MNKDTQPDPVLIQPRSNRCFCTGCGDYFGNDEAHLRHRQNSECLKEKARRGAGLRTSAIPKSDVRQWIVALGTESDY